MNIELVVFHMVFDISNIFRMLRSEREYSSHILLLLRNVAVKAKNGFISTYKSRKTPYVVPLSMSPR